MPYIVVSARKSKQIAEPFFTPLAYGRDGEPAPDHLLRRERASIFSTQEQAWAALKTTLREEQEQGSTWMNKFHYAVFEAELV